MNNQTINTRVLTFLFVMFTSCFVMAQSYTWKQKASYGAGPVRQAVAFSINDKIYVGTGYNEVTGRSKQFWEYNTATNIWTRKADFGGIARYEAIGFSLNGKGYIGTGDNNELWEYDPLANTWKKKTSFPTSYRRNAAVFVIGDKAYVGTGDGPCNGYCKDLWEYDAVADTWTQKADFPGVGRYGAVAFSIDGFGYIGTGTDGWKVYKDFYKYDPQLNTWSAIADFGGSKRFFASAFALKDKGYVGIGLEFLPNIAVKDFWEYDPLTNTWIRKVDFEGVERHYAVGTATATKGYFGTGDGNDGPSPGDKEDFWEYSPEEIIIPDPVSQAELEMPNVFTPNNDGINDVFRPQLIKGIKQATLKVYNRWGQKIIETSDVWNGWDGTNKSQVSSDGTYFWMIDYMTEANESGESKGFVTMIK